MPPALSAVMSNRGVLPLAARAMAASWVHTSIRVTVESPRKWRDGPELPGLVRSAWGKALAEGASAAALEGSRCPWRPPCTYDLLINGGGRSKPYVIAVDFGPATTRIQITLFGSAGERADEAADALVRAVRGAVGRYRNLQISDREITRSEGMVIPAAPRRALISLLTPVSLRDTADNSAWTPAGFIASICRRVNDLSPWQSSAAVLDPEVARQALARVRVVDSTRAVETRRRWSRRQGRAFPIPGQTGDLLVEGDLSPLAPILSLGEVCYAGGRSTHGYGRYRIEWGV